MSIIAEALKKAKKERDGKTMTSEEYLHKILGPERKEIYIKEESKDSKPIAPPSKTEGIESPDARNMIRSKALITSGILLLLAIMFLTVTNIFLIPLPEVKVATSKTPEGTSDLTEVPLEAEAYTDVKSEIALIEEKAGLMDRMARAFRGDSGSLSKFELNGIVYDVDDSWAIINNKVVRVGDMLDGAKVISIAPQKVVLLFEDERFDLIVE